MITVAAANTLLNSITTWFIVVLLVIELLVKLGLNPIHQLGIVEDHNRYEELSDRQRTSALSVAGLVVAGLAIILSDNPQDLTQQVEIFGAAFGLLLIAAFAHEMTRDYRFVLTFQELTFEYGLLLMVYGLYLLVVELVPDAQLSMLVVFVAVFVFRFLSLKGEIQAHRNQFKGSEFETRRDYFQAWINRSDLHNHSVVSEIVSLNFLRKNRATVAILALMGSVYLSQLYLAGSTAPEAAFTAIPELPREAYVALSPWLHSYHAHLLSNALVFALLGGWTERQVGSAQFVFVASMAGYLTNFAPSLLGLGGLGIGASGITNVLWAFFTLSQLSLYNRIVHERPVDYRTAIRRMSLFLVGLLFVLKSIAEFTGYITPPSGSATGAHLLGVVLGLAWFLYRYADSSIRGSSTRQQA